jgi:hypothetical protein
MEGDLTDFQKRKVCHTISRNAPGGAFLPAFHTEFD